MYSVSTDTIAAKATPPGKGGVGIIRISGELVPDIAQNLVGEIPQPRVATLSGFLQEDGSMIDQGIIIYFKAPHSFTGEDVVELQGHGGPVVMDLLLQRVLQLGARVARPGEFSERAFLNNKIDLTQAEAIADLIDASSEKAARSAIHSLQGGFSKEINQLIEQVIFLRMYVEAAIDFPDEEVDFLSDGKIQEQLVALQSQLTLTLAKAKQGAALNEGFKVVIVGLPNAGKSSLLNYLSGEDTAIVSDIAGTTRDVIKESILIDGVPLKIVDTAGIRSSPNVIEAEGIKRAWQEIPNADQILLIVDAVETSLSKVTEHHLIQELQPHLSRVTVVRNKIDLTNEETTELSAQQNSTPFVINVSAKTGDGIDVLKEYLKVQAGVGGEETVFIARRRHLDALHRAQEHVNNALVQLINRAGELVAEELRIAHDVLSEITGEFRSDDLLGKIFSSFCIGK